MYVGAICTKKQSDNGSVPQKVPGLFLQAKGGIRLATTVATNSGPKSYASEVYYSLAVISSSS